MTQGKAKLLPFYLVIDVSYSMDGDSLTAANAILPELADVIARNPLLSGTVWFSVIDFSDDARVQLPLCDPLDPNVVLPGLTVRGATSYAAAFRLLRQQIEQDVLRLKGDNHSVHRPAVFFLSDGAPSDVEHEWRSAFRDLTEYDRRTGRGFAMYPTVIPFGVDQAPPKIMHSLIHPPKSAKRMRAFLTRSGPNPADAARILVSNVLNPGMCTADDGDFV